MGRERLEVWKAWLLGLMCGKVGDGSVNDKGVP